MATVANTMIVQVSLLPVVLFVVVLLVLCSAGVQVPVLRLILVGILVIWSWQP